MKYFRIVDILRVMSAGVLLELRFHISLADTRHAFTLAIRDDHETLSFTRTSSWTSSFTGECYDVVSIDRQQDALGRLIGNEIRHTRYGIGRCGNTGREGLCFFRLQTDRHAWLCFNNGREVDYSFERPDQVTTHAVYTIEWL
ncbi:hypothetical protein [Chitinophaga nivalis]|uniref:Uncharacterized protein n=1 Tax=Chitinophaga nivalis TaxID=2991709 RepID=A0ABT3IK21_9BACT|nr:hypothetical protein [Chitinophaga nivalis]MCW3466011.1 hypothetical protein [Chitinophaga nivalis]MCW3484298.1 hypothetical protein [Chitinophaga nivalis]